MAVQQPWDEGTRSAILRHLDVILTSPGFERSKRLGAFLRWVVEQTLAGGSAGITERAIAIAVYGRAQDFDPKIDGTVRSEAMRLRHKLTEFYATHAGAGRVDIPKGGYVPQFTGFAVAKPRRRISPIAAVAAIVCLCLLSTPRNPASGGDANRRSELAKAVREGTERLRIGDNIAARNALLRAAALAPDDPSIHIGLSLALVNLNLDSEGIVEARRAAELAEPGTFVARKAEAQRRNATRDWTGALPLWRELAAGNPHDPDLLREYANVQFRAVEHEEALRTIRAARELAAGAENPELDRMEALALGVLNKPVEAAAIVARGERVAESLGAQSARARLTLLEAGLRYNLNDFSSGERLLERARQMCGDLGDEMCVARTLRVDGNHMVSLGRYRDALTLYERAMPVAMRWQSWGEIVNLLDGLRETERRMGELKQLAPLAALKPFDPWGTPVFSRAW
jgi:Flp pilus assembly protein TadD